ncbi:MAG: HEPN domain-containing protein [bacterium]
MQENEKINTIVREWVEKAENDLKNAAHTLKLDEDCPTDTVCFHAQQVVEKYLKALLVLRGIAFPKVHNIEELVALLSVADCPDITDVDQDLLTDYATVTRYPGDSEPIPLAEARRAVAIARRVRKSVRRLLPKQALYRRRM